MYQKCFNTGTLTVDLDKQLIAEQKLKPRRMLVQFYKNSTLIKALWMGLIITFKTFDRHKMHSQQLKYTQLFVSIAPKSEGVESLKLHITPFLDPLSLHVNIYTIYNSLA